MTGRDARDSWVAALTNPGMGTEAAGPLLECLVRMARPRRVLEVGAGSTSLHLLAGLVDAKRDADADRSRLSDPDGDPLRTSVLHPAAASRTYEPILVVVDDLSVDGTTAGRVTEAAQKLGYAEYLKWLPGNFFELSDADLARSGPFDLIWLDAGSQADDVRFVRRVWPHLEAGGLLCVHEPHIAALVEVEGSARPVMRMVPSPVLQELRREARGPKADHDVLALTEPHKFRQGGVVLVRKRSRGENERPDSLGQELATLGDVPVPEGPLLGAAHVGTASRSPTSG